MAYEPIVFDFDGTICDSFGTSIEILNSLSQEFGFRKVMPEDLSSVREMSSSELLMFLRINRLVMPFIVYKAKEIFQTRLQNLRPINGIADAIRSIQERGHPVGILTSNSLKNVNLFLEMNHLTIFDFIYADSSIFGKASNLKKMLKERGMTRNFVTYVGDEVRDVEAARSLRMRVIAVAWGYQARTALSASNPDLLIDDPYILPTVL